MAHVTHNIKALVTVVLLATLAALASTVYAHFGIVLPTKWMANLGEKIKFYFFFGHAFEHEILPVKYVKIISAYIVDPDGIRHKVELRPYNSTFFVGEFTCEKDGDYIIAVEAVAKHGGGYCIAFSKAIVHCGVVEKGWNRTVGLPVEIVPLTRPYGLEFVAPITGIVLKNGKPLKYVRIEWEPYHGYHPAKLLSWLEKTFPYPDAYLTKATLTDPNGEFTVVIPYPGVWVIAAVIENATWHGYRGEIRASLTVYVDQPVTNRTYAKMLTTGKTVSELKSELESVKVELRSVKRSTTGQVPGWITGLAGAAIGLAVIAIIIAIIALTRKR